jgi:hypothetical protein
MQAMSWGATDCTGYVKMLPENDIIEPVITSENRRKMNHITGFISDKVGAHPLATTGFRFHKKKKRTRGISKREYDITGYVASRMVRPKSLRKIVDYTQPVMMTLTINGGKYTACVTTGYDTVFLSTFLGA